MDNNLNRKIISNAILLALMQMSSAYAEEASTPSTAPSAPAVEESAAVAEPVAEEKKDEPLNLDKIVVTGAANKISKMKSSVSVSTLSTEQIQNTGATNAAEILRSIPGVRVESSGGQGNANITVRGLPVSAGGGRYVQFQEDGLPILQFGDIAFGTADQWLRTDYGINKIEVVRGGSASTLSTNSPGGIINFISNDGKTEVQKVGVTAGLNFDEWRTDFAYGKPIDNSTRFFVSGFYRQGEGVRDTGSSDSFKGGQIKANLTHDFESGGFIKVLFKHLDDQTPSYLPVQPSVSANGTLSSVQGIDPRTFSLYKINFPRDISLNSDNSTTSSNVNDGLTVKSTTIGFEFDKEIAGINVNNKFRYADIKGRFISPLPNGIINEATGDYNVVVFNVNDNDLSNVINDFKLSKAFNLSESSSITPYGGLYYSKQKLDLTWNFNGYSVNIYNKTAVSTGPGFGGCCSRDFDIDYTTISPYVGTTFAIDNLTLDGSVRRDNQEADGSYAQAAGGVAPYGRRAKVDYDLKETSYSVGANYQFNRDLAVFGRTSKGYAFNADRMVSFDNYAAGRDNLSNGSPIAINEVKQHELGVKWRNGDFSTFVTFFKADTDESNYDAVTRISTQNSYDAKGVEIEAGYAIGNFRLRGGGTYTDAEITKSNTPSLVGTVPNRQPKWIYQFNPNYLLNDQWQIGTGIIGNTKSQDNGGRKLNAYAVVNPYVRYTYDKHWSASIFANNIFNKIGYTESNAPNEARSIDGRSVRASVVYSF